MGFFGDIFLNYVEDQFVKADAAIDFEDSPYLQDWQVPILESLPLNFIADGLVDRFLDGGSVNSYNIFKDFGTPEYKLEALEEYFAEMDRIFEDMEGELGAFIVTNDGTIVRDEDTWWDEAFAVIGWLMLL